MKFQRCTKNGRPSPIELISNKQGKYLTLTPIQPFEVGKRATEYGVTMHRCTWMF